MTDRFDDTPFKPAGWKELTLLRAMTTYLGASRDESIEASGLAERIEALLNNRRDLIAELSRIELMASDIEASDFQHVAYLLAKAKELDNG